MRSRRTSRDRAVLPSRPKNSLAERVAMERHQDIFCVVGGVPCQDWSVAGKRGGIKGQRSGLVYEFARVLQELRPAWFVFENVPGLLSANDGRDFAEVIRLFMVECGYGICWRVLNSQFFGVAQRRRRLFIVGSLGRPCPAEILFDTESGEGDFAASGETRQDTAAPLTSGSGVTSNSPGRRREDDENLAYCLREDPGGIGQGHNTTYALRSNERNTSQGPGNYVARSTTESCYKRHDEDTDTIVIQDVRGQRDKKQNGIGIDSGGPSYTLDKTSQHAVAFRERVGTLHAGHQQGGWSPSAEEAGDRALVGATSDPNRVRDFAGLPEGLDSARYRALGNAVTVQVARWIARRIVAVT